MTTAGENTLSDANDIPELVPTAESRRRRSTVEVWDETTRPVASDPPAVRAYTVRGRAAAAGLKEVHGHLRAELAQVLDLIQQVARGTLSAHEARLGLAEMKLRQNNWAAGAYCASYCLFVAAHHAGEDHEIFPYLRSHEARLGAVIDRLEDEHRIIHQQLDRIDQALLSLIEGRSTMAELGGAIDVLSDALLSHLAYEEAQLLEALARHFA